MKALIYKKPFEFLLDEIPYPHLTADSVIVRVHAVGVCGSDIHGFAGRTGRRTPGMVMGHEICGEIVEIGKRVSNLSIGQHVVIQPIIYCGKCKVCKEGKTSICLNKQMVGINMGLVGGLSEYINIPAKNVFPIDTLVPFSVGTLVEPFAVGAGAVGNAQISEGDTISIIGAGMIGMSILLMSLEKRPAKIFVIDQNKRKLKIAEQYGAIPINFNEINPVTSILKATNNIGVDVAIEAVGVANSVNSSIHITRPGGRIVWVGNSEPEVVVNMQEIVVKAKEIIGVYCYTDKDFLHSIHYIEQNLDKISGFVEEVVDMNHAQYLYTALARMEKEYFRAVIEI